MTIPPHVLDEIRARILVSEVVGRRVKLTKAGRELRGLSPFQAEKSPSFFVNDQKGFYHCFSSGRHGDVFRFLMETEGLTFPEAAERLAAQAGVTLPKPDRVETVTEQRRAGLVEVMELAAKWFEAQLHKPVGAAARAYITRRGLAPETVKEFRIGYAPADRDALRTALVGQGASVETLLEAGLIADAEDGAAPRDRFRDRLMIPIQDRKGAVIAFGGRALRDGQQPKYLNSPETPLFHKGRTLFNLHRAAAPAREAGAALVVEGYLDAISVYQAGYRPAVASMGTAFTEEQIGLMWRLAPEPVVCFDGDKAGVAAAERAVDRILPHLRPGHSFSFAFLADGKDPDDVAREGGREAVLAAVARGIPLADVLWRREVGAARIDTPERQAAFEARVADLLSNIRDAAVRNAYRTALRVRVSDLFWRARRGATAAAGVGRTASSAPPTGVLEGLEANTARLVLGLAVEYPELIDRHLERLEAAPLDREEHDAFRRELLRIAADGAFDPASIDQRFASTLTEVHGDEDEAAARPRGHAARARLPLLRLSPAPEFVERLFLDALSTLEIQGAEREVEAAAIGDIDEAEADRLMGMIRENAARRAELAASQKRLADEAERIRAATGAR